MCEFHDSNGHGFGAIWWTDKLIYFSSIDVGMARTRFLNSLILVAVEMLLGYYSYFCIVMPAVTSPIIVLISP